MNKLGLIIVMAICGAVMCPTPNHAASRFTDNGNGTVSDNITGLMWQPEDDKTMRTWQDALAYCEGLSQGVHSDWRLPDIKELRSIVDNTVYNPAIDTTAFPNTNSFIYWSSSTYAYNTNYAWYVDFSYGVVIHYFKAFSYYVRCVR